MSPVAPRPGFQGSETSRPEMMIYTHGDRVLVADNTFDSPGGETIALDGRTRDSENPSLIALQTNKALGPAAGTWMAQVKVPRHAQDMWESVQDDDWVDISFIRHGRKWHTMRGLVEENREGLTVGGTGATSKIYTLTGKDFGVVWEKTPVWFSQFVRQNVSGHFSAKVFSTQRADAADSGVPIQGSLVLGSPRAAVRGYLFGFLEKLGDIGRENWNPPADMPNIKDGSFVQSLLFDPSGFTNEPARKAIDPNFIMPNGTLWDLAKEWSDPLFTELFVDLVPAKTTTTALGEGETQTTVSNTFLTQDEEYGLDDTKMGVIFRDKPFPVVDDAWEGLTGEQSIYLNLPLFTVRPQDIGSMNIGRSGAERYNAYFVSSVLHQEAMKKAALDLGGPLWDTEDIKRHGLRRFDVQVKYSSADADLVDMARKQRLAIRDWYSLNPFYFNGTLELKRGFPDIRIGVRLRVPGIDENTDRTFYVESVGHNWALQSGTKTTLGVTRGWRGTDESLLSALKDQAARYELAQRSKPGE